MAMMTSARGKLEIISHEAIVLCPYRDSVGVWSFGIGHTAGAGDPHPADMPKAVASPIPDILAVFSKDLAKFEERVNKAFTRELTQSQFDAAVSFDFNTGAIDRASWVHAFNTGNLGAVGPDMMIWRVPASVKARRQEECDLFLKGLYSSDGFATIYMADAAGHVEWGKGKTLYVGALLLPPEPNSPAAPQASQPAPPVIDQKPSIPAASSPQTAPPVIIPAPPREPQPLPPKPPAAKPAATMGIIGLAVLAISHWWGDLVAWVHHLF